VPKKRAAKKNARLSDAALLRSATASATKARKKLARQRRIDQAVAEQRRQERQM